MEQRVRRLEQDIMKLKAAYDQYFAGIERRPPEKLAQKVAREVRILTSTVMTNTALRFRNQQAISRYNIYQQYWQRNLRELEEGRKPIRRVVPPAPVPEATPGTTQSLEGEASGVFEVSTQTSNKGEMDKLFSALTREYKSIGNGKTPDMEKVRSALEQQTKAIHEKYGSEKVAFKVINKDGKVTIKAGPADRRKT
ncbi:MAG: MXAN_5187 C-terminal domain-containing protein [bacterium]|nr:hypothetical protein [bacterium]MDT8366879.1 MXAN_5187 C-terminal domain-containing protein [bacterium]